MPDARTKVGTCEECGQEARGGLRGPIPRWCSKWCRSRREIRARNAARLGRPRHCSECKAEVSVVGGPVRFVWPLTCSPACKRERKRRGDRERIARILAGGEIGPISRHSDGYTRIGMALEHRVVMSRILGRSLHPWENVHHKNGIRHDNRPENLELWVKAQPAGQRLEDLLSFVRTYYADELAEVA